MNHRLVRTALVIALGSGCSGKPTVDPIKTELVEQTVVIEPERMLMAIPDRTVPFFATDEVATVNQKRVTAEYANTLAWIFSTQRPLLTKRGVLKLVVRYFKRDLIAQKFVSSLSAADVTQRHEKRLDITRALNWVPDSRDNWTTRQHAVLRDDTRWQMAFELALREEYDVNVSEVEVEARYQRDIERYKTGEQVHAHHILIQVDWDASGPIVSDARKRAEEVYKLAAKNPKDFPALAKAHSEGPSAKNGGDLSYFARGRMVPQFEDVAFATGVGEVSQPVRSRFGFHVIWVVDKKPPSTTPLSEVSEKILSQIEKEKWDAAETTALDDFEVEVFLENITARY